MARYDNILEIEPNRNGEGLRIGIVMCRFNTDVCEGLLAACTAELLRLGVASQDILIATIPGALEAPLTLKTMAQSGKFDGLVALGAVIRGETYHFEVVSNESAAGISDVGLETDVPIANAILTTENDDQALVRMQEKGTDAAQVVVEMINLLKRLSR
ncbi:6,7-dimethyl-8-ribityllumazine synthase [Chitinivorax sp. B]|uniref:6,7-dimethyl-8-ribityllumazine synthase n=1 Tax=Chitinivorax sp. B TaxID=2502235 RepID=UPI0010F5D634|nr:6,7-dimethyl-8-ribityllumazine synthase [Chitinivorax sp. B]